MKISKIWEKVKKYKSILIFILTPLISAIVPLVIKTSVRTRTSDEIIFLFSPFSRLQNVRLL
jgi:hypothetical protein